MTIYTCKCGKTFEKNTVAGTTGFRMPDYGPQHVCYGCPFVCPVMTWDPTTQKEAVQNHECRASKGIRYDSTAALSLGDKCVGRIDSLDFDFLHLIREYADSLDGIEPDQYAFSSRGADYGTDGRYRLTIYPAANNKGISAKQQLFDEFFNPDCSRKDVSPEEEKEIVLNQIQDGKWEAQHIMMQYQHTNKVYFVKENDNGKFRAHFYYLENPSVHIPVGDMPICDTQEVAQEMLDDYAKQREFEFYEPDSDGEKNPEVEQQNFDESLEGKDDSVPLADKFPETEQEGDISESVNDVHTEQELLVDSENDDGENPSEGCSWQNASGGEDASQEDEQKTVPVGEKVSLRDDDFFFPLIAACDDKINWALRTAVTARQGFTFTAKVTFEPRGNAFAVKYETGYQFEPIKVKDKGELYEEIQITLDDAGNPIIPYDREHQMTFDEVPDSPPVTTTVDGSTGLVESVETADEWEPPTSDDLTNDILGDEMESEELQKALYPCGCANCPFFTVGDDGEEGCYFESEDSESDSYPGDIWEAVHMNGCVRPEVLHSYHQNDPENDEEEVS
ncbi:hypothetical protein [Clostridium merdae]|uniref:hypothetical protein n=1 Tax=Clostridium merdae TaxID=1958780 RepID=UPI000A268145|nr:hypothetical protein [Clostridium merdae]